MRRIFGATKDYYSMRTLLSFMLLLALSACSNEPQEAETAATTTESIEEAPDRAGEVFGATEDFSTAVALTELQDQLSSTDTLLNVSVRGPVDAVCQAKGCWMTLTGGEEEMMVKFKDYGFFVPKDIDGREVVVHGKAYYQVTTVEELRHYAEDAGQSAEELAAITEPKRELRFLASGVLLLPEEASTKE